MATIPGTTGGDDLTAQATAEPDLVIGDDGADTLAGAGGNDTIWGDDTLGNAADDARDDIAGGDGDDSVIGGGGGDAIEGNAGLDTLSGGAGNDWVSGGGGDDLISGGEGDDTFDGGTEQDAADYRASTGDVSISITAPWTFTGSDGLGGSDSMWGMDDFLLGSGNDTLDATGSQWYHRIEGNAGDDSLTGDALSDTILGGADDDTLRGAAGDDTLDGGAGADTAAFSGNKVDYSITDGADSGGAFTLVTDTNAADGDDGTDKVYGAEALRFADVTDPVCFMPGTLVATPGGERAVETLETGDLVLTADGRAEPVRWLGRQTVSTRFADLLRVLPVRVTAGALGEGLPRRDLLVSPDHALLLDGALVHAGALVNGGTIRREAAVPATFTYWHVELAGHSLVLAEGVPAETFVDNAARMAFDNWAEHEAAADPAPVAEMAYPRAKSARQVPAATQRRLAERAAMLAGRKRAAA